jgi:hypothetical protein
MGRDDIARKLELAIEEHARGRRQLEELLASHGLTRDDLERAGRGEHLPAARRDLLARMIREQGGIQRAPRPVRAALVAVPPHAVRI